MEAVDSGSLAVMPSASSVESIVGHTIKAHRPEPSLLQSPGSFPPSAAPASDLVSFLRPTVILDSCIHFGLSSLRLWYC